MQVQPIGGDTAWNGVMQISVNGDIMGTMSGDNNTTAELLTFNSITDGSGNLVIDLRSSTTSKVWQLEQDLNPKESPSAVRFV